jgi:hypothetical protein
MKGCAASGASRDHYIPSDMTDGQEAAGPCRWLREGIVRM